MAGSGFKTFAVGEVLTAADTNGYLMQGVFVFADSSARTTALGSPTEGQASYLSDSNTFEIYSGSAWVALLDLDTISVSSGNYTMTADLTVGGGDLSIGTTTANETLNIAGVTTASGKGSNLVVKGGDATGTNLNGGYLAIKPGMGTGSGVSGDILLQTGPAGASGASQNTATTVLTCTSAGNVVIGGNVGIGTTAPSAPLSIDVAAADGEKVWDVQEDGTNSAFWLTADFAGAGSTGNSVSFESYWTADILTLSGDGKVGIGETAPASELVVRKDAAGGRGGEITILNYAATTVGNEAALNFGLENSTYAGDNGNAQIKAYQNNVNGAGDLIFSTWSGSGFGQRMKINSGGLVHVDGEFTAGTKTFDIAHPTKGGDWRLRHASIEGPRHDLIYRGTVTLSGGTVTVDLDEASNMTDGTWEALCRDPWSMVASSGNAVEWVLDGKTLTITSDTADAVCSWIVMAERQDAQVCSVDAPSATDTGALIPEYERPPEPPPLPRDEDDEEAEEAA